MSRESTIIKVVLKRKLEGKKSDGKASLRNPGLKGRCHLGLVSIKVRGSLLFNRDTCESGQEDC